MFTMYSSKLLKMRSSYGMLIPTRHPIYLTKRFSTVPQPPEDKEKNTHLTSFPLQNNKMYTSLFPKNSQFSIPSCEALFKKTHEHNSESSQKKTCKKLLQYLLYIISSYPLFFEDKDERGFFLARWARNIWSAMGCKINARYHRYEFTLKVCKASEIITEKNAFSFFAEEASIGCTVPGAFKGKNSLFFAGREHNGTANAFFLGNVRTINDPKHQKIINETLPGHLLHSKDVPGTVTMRFFKEGDYIFIEVIGEGYGNFAYLNEKFAEPIFKWKLKNGINIFVHQT